MDRDAYNNYMKAVVGSFAERMAEARAMDEADDIWWRANSLDASEQD